MNNVVLFLFKNTRAVIKAQQVAVKSEIPCNVVPVPKEVSAECGMSLEVSSEHAESMVTVLQSAQIAFTRFYQK